MLRHFDHLGQFTLLLIEPGVVLLLLSQLGGRFKKGLEVVRVSSVLEEVDLGEELLSFLLELGDLLLELT